MRIYLFYILLLFFIQSRAQQPSIIHPNQITDISKSSSVSKTTGESSSLILDSLISYKFQTESDSFAFHKEEFNYDNKGNKIQRIIWRTPMMVPPLEKDSKTDWEYYQNGAIYSEFWSYWSSSENDWYFSSGNKYIYDSIENGLLKTQYWWDEDENAWIEGGTNEYFFDSKGELIFSRTIGEEQFNNELVFDEERNHISTHGYFWDETLQEFVLLYIEINTYNEYNNLLSKVDTSIIHYGEWDQDTLYGKTEYLYNTDQHIISIVDYYPDSSGEWIPGFKDEYEYEDDLCVSKAMLIFDNAIGDWMVPSWIEYYKYNKEGLIIMESDFSKDPDFDEHQILNKHYYYYSNPAIVSLDKFDDESPVSVYPNPSHGIIYIKSNYSEAVNILLFTIDGKLLLKNSYTSGDIHEVNLMSLPKGLYVLKIVCNNEEITQKLILQ